MLKSKRLCSAPFLSSVLTAGLFLLSTTLTAQTPIDAAAPPSTPFLAVADTGNSLTLPTAINRTETPSLAAPSIRLHPKGRKFVADYLQKNEADLKLVRQRSSAYFKTIESIFRATGLPVEMKYLAVIESELRTNALSPVGAAGMWQLMPQTARELGLRVSGRVDERRHFVSSTRAAAKYIKVLHAQFDDWLLVIAAYNSGAGTVYKAMKRAGSRDFWTLERFLPDETRAHVKRYIGAHYYFQGAGSPATLTKAEASKYLKAVAEYQEGMKVLEEIAQDLPDNATAGTSALRR
jgi:membrane-bound lytic murein transglycosylase D